MSSKTHSRELCEKTLAASLSPPAEKRSRKHHCTVCNFPLHSLVSLSWILFTVYSSFLPTVCFVLNISAAVSEMRVVTHVQPWNLFFKRWNFLLWHPALWLRCYCQQGLKNGKTTKCQTEANWRKSDMASWSLSVILCCDGVLFSTTQGKKKKPCLPNNKLLVWSSGSQLELQWNKSEST